MHNNTQSRYADGGLETNGQTNKENSLEAPIRVMWVGKRTKDWIVVCSWSPDTHVSSGHNEDNLTYNSTISDFENQIFLHLS